MKEQLNELKREGLKMKNEWLRRLKEPRFWGIQLLSLQTIVKYYALYSLKTMCCLLFLLFLKMFDTPAFDGISNEVLGQFLLQLYVYMKMVLPVFWLCPLVVAIGLGRVTRSKTCTFLKSCLFAVVVNHSPFLTIPFYQSIQTFEDLPLSFWIRVGSWLFFYFVMKLAITRYWDQVGHLVTVKPERNDSDRMNADAYFAHRLTIADDLKAYVVPLAITKEMNKRENHAAFIASKGNVKTIDARMEECTKVEIQLKYSLLPPVVLDYVKYDNGMRLSDETIEGIRTMEQGSEQC